ncbi:MAG: hypothetical protein F6K00_28265 [Leptolyngbya sp. SIOISBB]|nr:hypothetical protein [Leptolyngbya sp. SIOISBB]
MASKVGFDFDEFGGNVNVVIVKADKDLLENSDHLKSLALDGHFEQQFDQAWSFYYGVTYLAAGAEGLAKFLSGGFSTKAIYFYYGDASGWMGYQLFINGATSEEYSFGVDYDEEMAEAGIDPAAQRKAGTVIAYNDDGYQCLFWSLLRTQIEDEIVGGEDFIDQFLKSENAYIGWDLFTNH